MSTVAKCARSSSAIRRHSGYRSVLVSTHATLGHTLAAWRRNSSSGAVYSWEASDTNSTASAEGSMAIVAAPCTEFSPPAAQIVIRGAGEADQGAPRRIGVADDGGHRRGHVVVNRAHRCLHQAID